MKIVFAGHVDHGKSTLIGRLLHDTGSLSEGRRESVAAMCERRGIQFEWAFLLDAFQAERDQGVTIDTCQTILESGARHGERHTIIDAPGHEEFLSNMLTAASLADAGVLVIDARDGMQTQSRRHGFLLHLLALSGLGVAVTRMDMVENRQERFEQVAAECEAYFSALGRKLTWIIPVSGRDGDNVARRSDAMPWHKGPVLAEALEMFPPPSDLSDLPLRFPIQDVYRFDDRRILAGRIESGGLKAGDLLLFSPSNKTARVRRLECWPEEKSEDRKKIAKAGESTGITLEEQIFVERGEVASHADDPPIESDVFRARVFWLSKTPLETDSRWRMRLGPLETDIRIQQIERIIDTDALTAAADKPEPPQSVGPVERHHIAEVIIRSGRMLALDEFSRNPATGRFVLLDADGITGGGVISMDGYADQRDALTVRATNITRVDHAVTGAERRQRSGHRGGVIWLTGLSGSGKSTLALGLERRLHDKGFHVFALDGDNVRHGLNVNLGFSPEERAENIRRVGEVAALFARAGMIAVTAFISPYRADRDRVRAAAGEFFREVWVKADLSVCEARDPKGLYARARAGEIADFTGISAPYEEPESPDLVLDTADRDVDSCLDDLVALAETAFRTGPDGL